MGRVIKSWCNKSIQMISKKIESLGRYDKLLMYDSLFQVLLILFNALFKVEFINKILYVNLYIAFGLIMISILLKGIAEHFLIFTFMGCFFIFLMGQKPFMDEYNVFLTFTKTELDCKQYLVFITIMSFGLIITYFTYLITKLKEREMYGITLNKIINEKNCGTIIRALFYLTLPCALYMQIKIVIVRSSISYTNGYLINVDIPVIIKIGYYLFINFMIIYLAIKPKKKEMYPVLFIFLILEGGIQLIQGRRALFATTLLFIIWYLLKYYNIKWIRYRYLIIGAAGVFLLVILFYLVEQMRGNQSVQTVNIFEIVKSFLISTGGSDSVIANTIVRSDMFPKAKVLYIINPIIFNPVTLILTGKTGIAQGIDYVNNFNDFSHWISYLTESSLYESGHGMGTSYLAESYFVCGIIGVVAISIILGILIRVISSINFHDNFVIVSLAFVFVQNLFTLPRSALFDWFDQFTYFVISLILLYIVVKILKKDRASEKS